MYAVARAIQSDYQLLFHSGRSLSLQVNVSDTMSCSNLYCR